MATKTAKATKTTAKGSQAPAAEPVPVAIRSDQPQPTGSVIPTAAVAVDPLAALLAAAAESATPKAEGKKGERPAIILTHEAVKAFYDWIPGKKLFDLFETFVKEAKTSLCAHVFPLWVKDLWAKKSRPSTIRIAANNKDGKVDIAAQYIVQEKFKVQGATPQETIGLLVGLGLAEADATALVNGEIKFAPNITYRSSAELTEGHKDESGNYVPASDAEKAVFAKMVNFVLTQLTADERKLVMLTDNKARVADGFIDRVCQYAKSEDQLAKIFEVIQLVHYPQRAEFAKSDAADVQVERLKAESGRILNRMLGGMQMAQPKAA